jgi:3-oxoadipate enol-lactonase
MTEKDRMPRVETSTYGAIGYAEAGSAGLPIVFLHGVGSDKSVWHPQLAHFGQTRRAITFDYPGYGESNPAPEDMTRDDYAAAILSTMSELGVERAHICGLSLGGVVAIAMHHATSERCASLILADTFAVHPNGKEIYERSVAGSADMRAFAEARVDFLLAQPADADVRREVVETMSRIDPAAYRIGAEAVWLADQRDRATLIRVPTLILVGDQDRPTPPTLSEELRALIPHSRLEVIECAGHLTNLEQPGRFNGAIETFVSVLD